MNLKRQLIALLANYQERNKLLIAITVFVVFDLTFAGGIVQCTTPSCSWQDFTQTIANLLRTIVTLSFWIAVLLSVIGAFLIMFHGPKPDLYRKGIGMIQIAIFGYVLILLSGVIFDVILEFFQPRFSFVNFVYASSGSIDPKVYYNPLKDLITSGLQCGQGATSSVDKLISCAGEAINALSGLAVIFLGIAIFASAVYLISTPLFGLGNISKAWQILIWSSIGLVIVLLANVIADQIQRIIRPSIPFIPTTAFAQVKPGEVDVSWETRTVRVCPPSILGSGPCQYPEIQTVVKEVVDFIIQRLAPPLLVFLIIIGGFFYLLSPFKVENIKTGHRYIQWAVYGYVILLLITGILSVISVFFGGPRVNP
ncbi:MAG: hypothetical protein NZ822_02110 [Patescibacteria group bacterium]|nr:hypothetical protein [Patescibacteria group bacterium]